MTLEFVQKQAKKTSKENKRRKTITNISKIEQYLLKNGESKTSDLAICLNLSPARVRAILSSMENIEILGSNTNRRYKLKK